MKKFLSLVLALVMTMSLVTISAGAKDFTDDSKITYKEAVDVMSAIKVIDGYTDGSFNPQGGLTRGAAAKIICNMILGPTTAGALVADADPFKDVAVDNTFAGYADGTFRPAAPLTGYAFMKMLLGALGYDATIEGYIGENWSIQVAKRALNIGLDDGLVDDFAGAKALTREEACLYAFNTLNTCMVKYDSKSTITVGDIVISQNSEAKKVTDNGEGGDGTTDHLFREEYFSKLTLDDDDAEADDFGRPAHTWYANKTKNKIGTYADEALAIYAGADFDEDTLDDDFEDYTVTENIIYNGGDAGLYMEDLEESRKGYTIELYGDEDEKAITTIVVTEAYAAVLADITTDDDDKVESVDVDVYDAGYVLGHDGAACTLTIDVKDDKDAYALVKDYEKDDVFAIFVTPGWDADEADLNDVILAVDEVEAVEGTASAISVTDYYNGWIKVDGTKYDFAWDYSQADVAKDSEGTFYLYNGYVLHFEGTADDDDNYLFVVRGGSEEDKWGKTTYYAEVVFADGTTDTIVVDDVQSDVEKGLYTYTYDKKDDNYALESAAGLTVGVDVTKGKTAIKLGDETVATANGKTVFVNVKIKDSGALDKATVYTGYKSVSTMSDANAYIITKEGSNVATYVFLTNAIASTANDDMIYVAGASVSDLIEDVDLGDYYTFNAVVDGKIVEIMVDAEMEGVTEKNGLMKDSSIGDDDIYTVLTGAIDGTDYEYTTGDFKKAADDVITLGNDGAMSYTDDVTLYVVATDGAITVGSINRNYSDITGITYTVNSDGDVTCIYIEK